MDKRKRFRVDDNVQLTERIIAYFEQAGFRQDTSDNGRLRFIQGSSLLEAWKTDPLKWSSEVTVAIDDHQVTADFRVDTESQMNTAEEERVWDMFMENFQGYLQGGAPADTALEALRAASKRTRPWYIGWALLGAVTGGLVGILVARYSGSSMMGYLSISAFAVLFLKFRIDFVRQRYARQ